MTVQKWKVINVNNDNGFSNDGPQSFRSADDNIVMSESAYMDAIKAASNGDVIYSHYNDYESDGNCEMFALVGEARQDSLYGEVWYADQNGAYKVENAQAYFYYPQTYLMEKDIFLALEQYFTTGSVTHLWGVKDGKPFQPQLTDKGNGLSINNYNEIELIDSTYDAMKQIDDDWKVLPDDEIWTGHTYKPYYYYWNGENFREYGAIEISAEQLLSMKGASVLTDYINEEGATINEIYYRLNNTIQINYQTEVHDDKFKQTETHYFYISFRYNGGTVDFDDCEIGEGNYLKALNPSIAVYPDTFDLEEFK